MINAILRQPPRIRCSVPTYPAQNPEGQGEGALLACLNIINGNPMNQGTEFELDEKGEDYSDSIVWVPFEPVTAENVSQYK